jgi:hypothetical protein|tara:strand:+ start:151 stop:375 length:225 start_codon:yes stop_codon:yes gene_type:complete
MEKVNEINTTNADLNAFEVIMKCKELATHIDLANIILDNTSIDEKEMLINIIEGIRSLELEVIGFEKFIPEARA